MSVLHVLIVNLIINPLQLYAGFIWLIMVVYDIVHNRVINCQEKFPQIVIFKRLTNINILLFQILLLLFRYIYHSFLPLLNGFTCIKFPFSGFMEMSAR